MSFRDFKEDLLMAMVFAADAKPTKQIEPLDAANARNLSFREGWLRQAVNALNDEGLIKASFFMGGGENKGMRCNLTGAGIEQAEQIASRNGYDLYEELDEISGGANIGPIEAKVIPASDRIVKIDHNSPQFAEVAGKLDEVIAAAKASNSLKSNEPDEADQHIAELEAGKVVISARQADRTLVERLLLPALRWVMEKIADNVVGALVGALITLIAAYFGLTL